MIDQQQHRDGFLIYINGNQESQYQYIEIQVLQMNDPYVDDFFLNDSDDENDQRMREVHSPEYQQDQILGKEESEAKVQQNHPKKSKRIKKDKNGRPKNEIIEKEHLQVSRTYNDIIFHYARLLILLKIKQGKDNRPHVLNLLAQENNWLTETENIMEIDTFPSIQNAEKQSFVLHSNSLHFVFKHLRQTQKRKIYSEEELKFMFIGFLRKKDLLNTDIYNYLVDYWHDILFIVNHPQGDYYSDSQEQIENNCTYSDLIQPEENYIDESKTTEKKTKKKGVRFPSNKGNTELDQLSKQLENDPSIIAYEIACYLHACKTKFKLIMNEAK